METTYLTVFGDSIGWGAWDRDKGGWVNRLRLFFDNTNPSVEVYNCSIDGDTTADVIKHFTVEARSRLSTVVVFDVGVNDTLSTTLRGKPKVSLPAFIKNIETLTAKTRNLDALPIFIGLMKGDERKTLPVSWGSYYYSNKRIQHYDEALKETCRVRRIHYIKAASLTTRDLDDGLHPNARGHEKIFQHVKHHLFENNVIKLRNA